MLLALHNLYPSLRPYTQPFFELSYYDPASGTYIQGWDDVYFVFSAALALTAVRAISIEWILQPLARQSGVKRKASVRIAEQGWQVMYYSFVWATGLVCLFLSRGDMSETRWGIEYANAGSDSTSGRTQTTGLISARFGTNGQLVPCPA
jgi:hypothetical protein